VENYTPTPSLNHSCSAVGAQNTSLRLISSYPDYLHADVIYGADWSLHQQEVTDGQLVTKILYPVQQTLMWHQSVTFQVAAPPLYLRKRCPYWTAAEGSVPGDRTRENKKEK